MTYNVFGGTLNPTLLYRLVAVDYTKDVAVNKSSLKCRRDVISDDDDDDDDDVNCTVAVPVRSLLRW